MFLSARLRRLADCLVMLLTVGADALPAQAQPFELEQMPRLPNITLERAPNEPPWIRLQKGSSYKRRRPPRSLGPRIKRTRNNR